MIMTEEDSVEVNEKNVKLFVRIFPLEKPCESCAKIDTERKKIYIRSLQDMKRNGITETKEASYWCFKVDGIFYDSSQEDVYRLAAKDLPPKILDGVSCVLLGYGQTGSGKSFTINGLRNNWEHRGILPRFVSDMFVERANRSKVSKIEYRLSFVELRGREVTDLLVSEALAKIKIKEQDAFKNICLVSVKNEKDTFRRIFAGESRRSIVQGSTYPNSHLATSVITLHIHNASLITSWKVVTTAKIHFVEMAGNDTVGKPNCWKAAFDVGTANLTKAQLEQFFFYLRGSKSSYNITRTSNLIKLLGNALSATSVIRFISHVRITREDLDVTLSTLRFGANIRRFQPIKTIADVKPQMGFMLEKLQNEVNCLKTELEINAMFLQQEPLMSISKSRVEQIRMDVLNFLNGTISDFTLFSVSQAQVLLTTIKELYNKLTTQQLEVQKLKEIYENAGKENNANHIEKKNNRHSSVTSKETEDTKEHVGMLDKSSVTLGPVTGGLSKSRR